MRVREGKATPPQLGRWPGTNSAAVGPEQGEAGGDYWGGGGHVCPNLAPFRQQTPLPKWDANGRAGVGGRNPTGHKGEKGDVSAA